MGRHWLAMVAMIGGVMLAVPAQAGPCDAITNAFAYNECLSKQAPPKASSGRRVSSGDPEQTVRPGRRRGSAMRRGTEGGQGLAIYRSGGRVRATIDPWSGMRGTPGKKRRR